MIHPKISFQIIGTPPIPPLGPAALLKFVEPNVAYAAKVREIVGPECLFIGRWFSDEQPLDQPALRAREWHARCREIMRELERTSGPWAFEGYNEVAGGDAPDYPQARAYCAFEQERVRLMDSIGLRAVVLNASVGTPDWDEWAAYDPLLDQLRASKLRHLVGFHSYWADYDLYNRYHVFRFRRDEVAQRLRGLQIVDTEGGREYIPDAGLDPSLWGKPGWQRSCDADQFCRDLELVSLFATLDANYLGMTLFQYGSADPAFAAYDVAPILERLAADHRVGGAPSPEPLPEDEPEPTGTKVRWWVEEAVRQLEGLGVAPESRAMRILYSLIDREKGLLYRWEQGETA